MDSPKFIVSNQRKESISIQRCMAQSGKKRTVLFVLMLYVSVNNFSVISGQFPVYLGQTSTKQWAMCLAKNLVCATNKTSDQPVQ